MKFPSCLSRRASLCRTAPGYGGLTETRWEALSGVDWDLQERSQGVPPWLPGFRASLGHGPGRGTALAEVEIEALARHPPKGAGGTHIYLEVNNQNSMWKRMSSMDKAVHEDLWTVLPSSSGPSIDRAIPKALLTVDLTWQRDFHPSLGWYGGGVASIRGQTDSAATKGCSLIHGEGNEKQAKLERAPFIHPRQ